MKNIPKKLYMIWIGDKIPQYVFFSLNAYKQANPTFNIIFISFSFKQIENIFNKNIKNLYEYTLYESIQLILNSNLQTNFFSEIIKHQIDFYRFNNSFSSIQLLSDIYRLKLIFNFGGIYVDCDTFPIKPFDDKLLSLQNFIVTKHYKNYSNNINNVGDDNYFFGSIKQNKPIFKNKILQTQNKWWLNIQYLKNKQLFLKSKLKYKNNLDQLFYIEHYNVNTWKKQKLNKIHSCFLDNIIKL